MLRFRKRALLFVLPLALGAVACDSDESDLEPRDAEALVDAEADAELDDARPAAASADREHRRHGRKGRHHGPRKSPEERAAKMLARLDANGDGAISLAEAKEHRIAHKFAKIDADGDGHLSTAEIVTFKREHKREHRRGKRPHDIEAPVAG